MDAKLVAWLNANPRNYTEGVDLYKRLGNNPADIEYYRRGQSRQSQDKLYEAVRAIYYELKKGKPIQAPMVPKGITNSFTPTTELEAACKAACDKVYKEMMNVRAQLFALCPLEKESDENQEHAVRMRELYAIKLMDLQPKHQAEMDILQYVRAHGKLPDKQQDEQPAQLPASPVELERKRVNLLKAMSKLRLKEQTPARVQLMQQHQATLNQIQHAIDQL